MSSLQSAKGVIKPGGNILNVERASTSTFMLKGKKGKKKKPSGKGSNTWYIDSSAFNHIYQYVVGV